MLTVIAYRDAAVLCYQGRCYRALLGVATPLGVFPLHDEINREELEFRPAPGRLVVRCATYPALGEGPASRAVATEGDIGLARPAFMRLRCAVVLAHGAMLEVRSGRPPGQRRGRPVPQVNRDLMGYR